MFVNRETEISRLKRILNQNTTQLVVIYGRRRGGKSTLLRQIVDNNTVYFSADLSEAPLQIRSLAERIEEVVPGFSAPVYPGWDSLFRSLNR